MQDFYDACTLRDKDGTYVGYGKTASYTGWGAEVMTTDTATYKKWSGWRDELEYRITLKMGWNGINLGIHRLRMKR